MSPKKIESIPIIDPAWGLTDSHAHIDFEDYIADGVDGRADVLHRAAEAGVTDILIPATNVESFKRAESLLELNLPLPRLHLAIGIHPHEAKDRGMDLPVITEIVRTNKNIRAIGEAGLDYHYDFSPREIQKEVFARQLILAKETNKPVIIHCREAEGDTLDLLKLEQIESGVLHCFSGSKGFAEEALDLGLYISLSGVITFPRSEELREIVKTIPLDRLLIETDSPYLAPQARRGERNEPAYVAFTAQRLAEIRGVSVEEIVRATGENARRLFGW